MMTSSLGRGVTLSSVFEAIRVSGELSGALFAEALSCGMARPCLNQYQIRRQV